MIDIFQRILEIVGSFAGLIYGSEEFKKLRIIISLLVLIFSFLGLFYFFYLEKKYKIGTSIWLTSIKNFLEGFIKPEHLNREWKKIKDIFLLNPNLALKKVYKYLEEVINLYGYEEETLSEKFSKIPNSVFEKKQDFLRALHVLEIINKKESEEKISSREALALIRVIEKGLLELLIIDSQAQWAISLTLPQE
ncbi:MAG: hypothetical protein NZ866_00445 [Patescibacteria group bacterium]|nr:hypothetical protein [Patescibacteria group bacterium]